MPRESKCDFLFVLKELYKEHHMNQRRHNKAADKNHVVQIRAVAFFCEFICKSSEQDGCNKSKNNESEKAGRIINEIKVN